MFTLSPCLLRQQKSSTTGVSNLTKVELPTFVMSMGYGDARKIIGLVGISTPPETINLRPQFQAESSPLSCP